MKCINSMKMKMSKVLNRVSIILQDHLVNKVIYYYLYQYRIIISIELRNSEGIREATIIYRYKIK
jgi:hypothetical protein